MCIILCTISTTCISLIHQLFYVFLLIFGSDCLYTVLRFSCILWFYTHYFYRTEFNEGEKKHYIMYDVPYIQGGK